MRGSVPGFGFGFPDIEEQSMLAAKTGAKAKTVSMDSLLLLLGTRYISSPIYCDSNLICVQSIGWLLRLSHHRASFQLLGFSCSFAQNLCGSRAAVFSRLCSVTSLNFKLYRRFLAGLFLCFLSLDLTISYHLPAMSDLCSR